MQKSVKQYSKFDGPYFQEEPSVLLKVFKCGLSFSMLSKNINSIVIILCNFPKNAGKEKPILRGYGGLCEKYN